EKSIRKGRYVLDSNGFFETLNRQIVPVNWNGRDQVDVVYKEKSIRKGRYVLDSNGFFETLNRQIVPVNWNGRD
ncbi:hypothetical protein CPT12_28365, partial [Klebsiella pneumoniae]